MAPRRLSFVLIHFGFFLVNGLSLLPPFGPLKRPISRFESFSPASPSSASVVFIVPSNKLSPFGASSPRPSPSWIEVNLIPATNFQITNL